MDTNDVALSEFKKVKLEDWEKIMPYLQAANYEESNHNIINLMMWKHVYPIWYHEGNGWMLILGIHKGEWFLYMPLCMGGACFEEALRFGESIFNHQDVHYVLSCYTLEVKDRFLSFDSHFVVEEIRDGFDYIYPYEQLSTFSGKKMQKKRNHINAFLLEYGDRWQYHTMTKDDMEDVLEFLAIWEGQESADDTFLHEEVMGVRYLLTHWGVLPAKGGLIRIDGKVVGFAIGSYLNDTTVQMNVEKAHGDIRGLYPLLTREFLAQECVGAVWVNREDDVGHENIRQAKLSLHPAYMVEKYCLRRTKG